MTQIEYHSLNAQLIDEIECLRAERINDYVYYHLDFNQTSIPI
jgi:hypothetical protein